MSVYLGDFPVGQTIYLYFNTHKADGTPITLAGSPAISIYKVDSTTQTTTGPTLTVNFDSITGMHCVAVATTNSFYVAAADYQIVITTGTVDSISVVGTVVGSFSLSNRMPVVRRATAQAGAAGTITLDSSASASDDFYNKCTILVVGGTGVGQCRLIYDYTGSSKVANVSPNWVTNPDNTSVFMVLPSGYADLWGIGGTAQTAGDVVANVYTVAGYLDTKIAAILADTNELQTDWVNGGRLDLLIDAIKAKTDNLTFTVSNKIDSNVYTWNGTGVTTPAIAGSPVVTLNATQGAYAPAKAGDSMALTAAAIDAIWDEVASGHATAGSFGKYLDSDISANTDHITADYGATEQAAIDLLDDASGGLADIHTDIGTVAGYLDTEVAAILADTNELQTDLTNGGRLDLLIDGIKAKTDTIPVSPAAVGSAMTLATDSVSADALKTDAVTEIADGILKRDMSAVTGESSRSLLNALRLLRNKITVTDSTLSVKKEDDSTEAWNATVTGTPGATPITTIDPN